MILSYDLLKELRTTDSISRKNEIESAIEDRTQNIIEEVAKAFKKSNYWWAWEYYSNSDDDPPNFDPKGNIDLDDKGYGTLIYSLNDVGCNLYYLDEEGREWSLAEGCPITWLWDDFKEELIKGIGRYKQQEVKNKEAAKIRREELKQLKQQYTQSARQKLTPEELWATGLSNKMPKSLKHFAEDNYG